MMHRAFLQLATLLALLAVMAAAGGCVALYTVSRALERPDDAGGGLGPPLFPPVTTPPILPPTAIPAVAAQTSGDDGLPFNPYVTDTPSVPVPLGTGVPAGTAPPSNATPPRVPMPTETPPVAGPPPHDLIPRPSLPATPL